MTLLEVGRRIVFHECASVADVLTVSGLSDGVDLDIILGVL